MVPTVKPYKLVHCFPNCVEAEEAERSFTLFSYLSVTKSGDFGVGVIMQKLIQRLEKCSQRCDTCKISCGLLRLAAKGFTGVQLAALACVDV